MFITKAFCSVYQQTLRHIIFRPNMAVKGTFCPNALFKLGASLVVSGFCYHYPLAKRPLLLR